MSVYLVVLLWEHTPFCVKHRFWNSPFFFFLSEHNLLPVLLRHASQLLHVPFNSLSLDLGSNRACVCVCSAESGSGPVLHSAVCPVLSAVL